MLMTMLDLSTIHIRPSTAKWIDQQAELKENFIDSHIIAFPKAEYGWFIHVPGANEEVDTENVPADLLYLLGIARGHGCQWLCLDADAKRDDELQAYEWETEVQ